MTVGLNRIPSDSYPHWHVGHRRHPARTVGLGPARFLDSFADDGVRLDTTCATASRERAICRPRGRSCRLADARAGPRDDLVRALVRGVGSRWRTRLGLHRPLRPDRIPDRAAGGGAGAARLAGAAADGHADRSIRRTPRLHGAPRVLVARRIRRAADRQLRLTPGGGVPHRHGRIVLRGRRRVRVPLDAGGPAGHGPRRLRAGDDGAIAGGLRRAGGRGSPGLGGGVSRHQRGSPGLGGRVLPAGAESPAAPRVPPPSPR